MALKKKRSSNEIPAWIVTYGDMMSLLLCFFILLAAFSELKQPREYRKVYVAIQEALGLRGGMGNIPLETDPSNTLHNQLEELGSKATTNRSRAEATEANVPGRDLHVSRVHEGTVFTVGGTITFDPGSHELSETARRVLSQEVAPRIRDQRVKIRISGHAWGVEDLRSGLSYEDLSYERARTVRDFLVNECEVDPLILRIEAAGNTEPNVVPRSSLEPAGENRRVQVFQTEALIDQLHPDPYGTGR
ncbi:MAG: hypothetical protein EA378_08135 [Phycisphaerales bacterium]|nr:MAG: hypothetical protein EA378_08135 [Phycisphaerales bacterium]